MIGYGFVGKRIEGEIVYTTGETWLPVRLALAVKGVTPDGKQAGLTREQLNEVMAHWFKEPTFSEIKKGKGVDGWNTVKTIEEFGKLHADYLYFIEEDGTLMSCGRDGSLANAYDCHLK